MNDPRTASLSLHAHTNEDGTETVQMEASFEGEFQPDSLVDRIIAGLYEHVMSFDTGLTKDIEAEANRPRIVTLGGRRV